VAAQDLVEAPRQRRQVERAAQPLDAE